MAQKSTLKPNFELDPMKIGEVRTNTKENALTRPYETNSERIKTP